MQQVSSMMTSINTKKLPAIWNKLNIPEGTHWIVDYGAGRPETQELIRRHLSRNYGTYSIHKGQLYETGGPTYLAYDPYWGEVEMNDFALHHLQGVQDVDLCVCANVLNVVDCETIQHIIKEVTKAKNWIFQIYEGDKTGEGRFTKPGCWQQNKRTCEYLWIFNELGVDKYYVKGNFITNNASLLK